MSEAPFSKGDRVEILRSLPLSGGTRIGGTRIGGGGGGAWYSATVIRANARTRAQILVEYDGVSSPSSSSRRLRECVPWANARPAPPRELGRRFLVGEAVEAYAKEGWNQGVVLAVSKDESRYLVFLVGPETEIEFAQSNLRLRREWSGGRWDPPFPGQQLLQEKPSPVMELKPKKAQGFKISSCKKKPTPLFRKGKTVEVRSDEKGYEGAWYTAVIKKYLGKNNYVVEYLTLKTDDEITPLREEARAEDIRPYPPRLLRVPFRPLDKVDVWYNDGWWAGVISKVVHGSTFVVYFSTTNEELVFQESDLRIHQEWVNQKWIVPSLDAVNHLEPTLENPESTDSGHCTNSKAHFLKGTKVEVRSDEEGYQGSWYTAKILDSIGEDKYLVEYQTLKTEDETQLLREQVLASHIRPSPTGIVRKAYGFSRLEAVDAWYNEGWWMGHVSQILKDCNYQVYFRSSNEEIVFKHSEQRPHQEWIRGQWVTTSMDHITV